MKANLGKILRLNPDGSVPADNPFAAEGGVTAQIWSLGHRNILGLAFDGTGRLWNQEMGPKGGDEVNLVTAKANYGYPIVSNGDHYDGRDIPDHPTRPEFTAPKLWWNPSVSPAGLVWYGGDAYPGWKNSLLMGALSGEGLIRMAIDGDTLHKSDRWDFGARIREVEVRARVGGILLERNFDEGSRVEAGTLLFHIDPATYEAQVALAKAQVLQAQAQLGQAKRSEARARQLAQSGAMAGRKRFYNART